jgi:hypothetical protein
MRILEAARLELRRRPRRCRTADGHCRCVSKWTRTEQTLRTLELSSLRKIAHNIWKINSRPGELHTKVFEKHVSTAADCRDVEVKKRAQPKISKTAQNYPLALPVGLHLIRQHKSTFVKRGSRVFLRGLLQTLYRASPLKGG